MRNFKNGGRMSHTAGQIGTCGGNRGGRAEPSMCRARRPGAPCPSPELPRQSPSPRRGALYRHPPYRRRAAHHARPSNRPDRTSHPVGAHIVRPLYRRPPYRGGRADEDIGPYGRGNSVGTGVLTGPLYRRPPHRGRTGAQCAPLHIPTICSAQQIIGRHTDKHFICFGI